MQWISVGSGIEHAESGGTPAGQMQGLFEVCERIVSNNALRSVTIVYDVENATERNWKF